MDKELFFSFFRGKDSYKLKEKPTLKKELSSYTSDRTEIFGPSRELELSTLEINGFSPLSVNFQEVCHACFSGFDDSKLQAQVRILGDLKICLPADTVQGIIKKVNPFPLQFQLINSEALGALLPNKDLIQSISKSNNDSPTTEKFELNMKSLHELLKQQSEQNPGASNFIVDVLKYEVNIKYPG